MSQLELSIELALNLVADGRTLDQAAMVAEARFGTPAASLIHLVRSTILETGLGF